ncbi:hypothetical protein BCh11DRAFT_04168 [Burkholderia sp. Ch1-1]|uniref:Uncharacterized protein n=1 Tax=Paraburkholderia dioscoreae TaxID=2604047 RepID=A0A5Q4Z1I7_9BURK|nr:hypothetical protein BCh11DRAFT_04168 [Burkholderia sp. Ch1-1]VVD26792.1 conserved protein of unknown function [Paraburkholderia dioscoreae]
MIEFFSRLSWLFFNVGVPVCAPFALLPLLSFSRFYRQSSKGIAIRTVEDGAEIDVDISDHDRNDRCHFRSISLFVNLTNLKMSELYF